MVLMGEFDWEEVLKRYKPPIVPRYVFLFSGHMIDAPGRKEPRFPPEKDAPPFLSCLWRGLSRSDWNKIGSKTVNSPVAETLRCSLRVSVFNSRLNIFIRL